MPLRVVPRKARIVACLAIAILTVSHTVALLRRFGFKAGL